MLGNFFQVTVLYKVSEIIHLIIYDYFTQFIISAKIRTVACWTVTEHGLVRGSRVQVFSATLGRLAEFLSITPPRMRRGKSVRHVGSFLENTHYHFHSKHSFIFNLSGTMFTFFRFFVDLFIRLLDTLKLSSPFFVYCEKPSSSVFTVTPKRFGLCLAPEYCTL